VAYGGGLEIPRQMSQGVHLRLKQNNCVNYQNPILFVVSQHVPSSPKHLNVNLTSIAERSTDFVPRRTASSDLRTIGPSEMAPKRNPV
jgi:hypothetical protein